MKTSKNHPPLDPELAAAWPAIVESGLTFTDVTPADIPRVREQFMAGLPNDEFLRHGGRITLTEREIPGPDGAPPVPALILAPAERSTTRRPCVFFTSNGGKILRSTRIVLTQDMLDWIVDLGVVLVSVAPRVGPEDPHPAQVEDAYAGLVWTAAHADELGIDPERIIIMGKSGGGGIAAATALLARDRGGPALSHQVLIYPMLDDREVNASSRFEGVLWDRATNKVGWRAILGDAAGGPDVSPYAAAARATDLTRLPPAYLEVGSAEVFRDEIVDYATRLLGANVPVELHMWTGGTHAFELFVPDAEISKGCVAARTSYLKRALHRAK